MLPFRLASIPRLVVFSIVLACLSGCSLLRGDGSKQRLDPPPTPPHRPIDTRVKTMLIEVTTDASGAVVTVEFKRSSGSAALDNYVAENIRHNWPAQASTRSLVELTYSVEKGFSDRSGFPLRRCPEPARAAQSSPRCW